MSEKAPRSSAQLIASIPATDHSGSDEVPTTAGPYRLYKRRWVGVFAMVGTTFFSLGITCRRLDSLFSRLWPPPVGHGLGPYPTTVLLFILVTIGHD
jgi:hypothetical protein